WNWLVSLYPISMVAPFTLLVPFFGMSSAALVLSEPIYVWKVGAGMLIVSGLMLHFLAVKKRIPENKNIA
ncbi:MAG: O-acetylserine/cysteine exporter, partial [Chlamydiia bacterium]|nr:O-acetylserine/cysteine exporter [Chlamydiia bacterium]